MPEKQKIIVILGPTASGKSDLAVKIAQKFNGEIISADSRQVYKGLNIGSNKITMSEMKGISHHLLDVASPKKTFTVAQYKKLAERAIQKIISRGKIPIICGGTGLYIDAVLNDFALPQVKPNAKLRHALEKKPTEELFAILQKKDPRRAKNIDQYNRHRLIRAIEIAGALGKVPPLKTGSKYNSLKIGISVNPAQLKPLLEKRLKKRITKGLIKEVKNLREKNPKLSWQRLDNFGLEYRFASRYLRGLISKVEMEKIIVSESMRYAKRQMTWFRRDKNITWIQNGGQAMAAAKKFIR